MVDYIKSLTPLTPSGRARVLFSMSAHSPAPRRGPCSPIASGFDFWSATFVFQDLRPHTHAQIAQLKSPAVGSTVPGFRQTLAVGASSGHWLRPRAGRANRRRRCRCRQWRTMAPAEGRGAAARADTTCSRSTLCTKWTSRLPRGAGHGARGGDPGDNRAAMAASGTS